MVPTSFVVMPRPRRYTFAGECYHVLNRANRKAEVFHDSADYQAFIRLIEKAQQRIVMPLIAYCLMPNHIHLVVRPDGNGDIARWMQWLFTTHARHYHEKYGTTGHVWQGRYKHFPVQGDHHLLTLAAIRRSVNRQRPFGADDWVSRSASSNELQQTMISVGRPRRSRSGTICQEMGSDPISATRA